MQILKEIVRNVAAVLLLTAFFQMLLPSNSMQRYIKVAVGLFVLLSFLNPFLQVADKVKNLHWGIFSSNKEHDVFSVWGASGFGNGGRDYVQSTEQQIVSILKLVNGLKDVQVRVELQQGEKASESISRDSIKKITVTLPEMIKEVKKETEKDEGEEDEEERRRTFVRQEIVYTVCRYFGLKENLVTVNYR